MNCFFCEMDQEQITTENDLAKAFFDLYPVQEGHTLIVPKRHIESYFDATEEEIAAIHKLIRERKNVLDEEFKPDGYNIGVNIGEYGGQTVPHFHVHLIPRYEGDIENPAGGIRRAIPNVVPYQRGFFQ